MRIIAFGDIHSEPGNFASIPGLGQADSVIITGDLTNYGGRRDATSVLAAVRAQNKSVLALPGNLDQKEVNTLLEEEKITLHGRGLLAGDNVAIHGVGGSNITPFKTPNEYSEEEIADLLDAGFSEIAAAVKDGCVHILVAHPPPVNSTTDRIADGVHVGSLAVREFIENHKPALCLTGHIHEACAVDSIGPTTVLNPGMLKEGGYIDITITGTEVAATLERL